MRKIAKILSIVAAMAMLGSAGTANADLQALGAVNPATGYPFWYQDTNGLALSLCLDQNGFCLLPAAFVYPADRTGINAANFPDEAFYYMADTAGLSPGGTIDLILYEAAVESGFIGAVVDGGQAAFTRIRIRADVTLPGTYTVTHPYGEKSFVVGAVGAGNEINDTVDVPGLVLAPFDQNHPSLRGTPPVLPQDVGPFLRRADGVILVDPTNPNNRYIGLPGQAVAVTGSPTGNNFVRITGPTADTFLSNTLSLMGKIVGLEIAPTGAQDFGVVRAGAAPDPSTTKTFTVTNLTGALTGIPVITPPAGYTVTPGTCNAALTATGAGSSCTFDISFTPLVDGAVSGNVTFEAAPAPIVSVAVTGIGDGIAPTLTVGPNLFTNAPQATISGTATDNLLVHDIIVSLGGVIEGTSTVTNGNWSFVASGFTLNAPNVFTVDAVDAALPTGNTTTSTITVTHDNILPAVSLTSPVNASLISNPAPNLTFTATDTNLSASVVSVDNAIVTPTPVSLGPLADGPHSVAVDTSDAAGNHTIVTNSFTVDATPPVITVVSPRVVNARVGQTNPALTVTVADANPPATANTAVTLDGVDVTANATLGPFTVGSAHTLVVTSTDGAGNLSTTTLPFTIILSDGRIVAVSPADPGVADALLALKHAVGILPLLVGDQFAHGDVAPLDANGVPQPNGVIDVADALTILKRAVGLPPVF